MILYIMRHGETDWNREGKLQGRTNIPLNENGRRVAELTREGFRNVVFDMAITSPLDRAKETAEIILKGRNVPILEDDRIIEVAFGKYEGAQKSDRDEGIELFFRKPECYRATDGAESVEEVLEREKGFLEDLYSNPLYQDCTILITTHGAALSGMLCNMKNWSVADFWKGGLHTNCGFSIVEVTDGKPTILQEAIVAYGEKDLK